MRLTEKKSYRWWLVALLWGVALLNYMDRQMLATMRPSMQTDIPELASAANFGRLMGIFLWIYGCMSPVSGMIADRFNRKWIIVGSLFVWSGVTFGMGYADHFNTLYVLRAIMGVSEALYIPAGLSLIADFHDDRTRSLAVGLHMTGLYLGQAIGGFGATIAANYSWHTTFHSFGMVGMLYALLLLLFLQEKNNLGPDAGGRINNDTVARSLHHLFQNRGFWLLVLYFAISSLPGWAAKNWLPTLFAENLQLPMSKAGPIATITVAVSSFIGVLFGGALSDKWVTKHIRGRIYTSAIGLALTIPSLLLLGFGNSIISAIIAAVCFGIGYGMFDGNNMPILCQLVPVKQRATGYGLMNMSGVFFGAFITDILGKSSDAGRLGKDFAMLALIVVAALAVQLVFLKPRRLQEKNIPDFNKT